MFDSLLPQLLRVHHAVRYQFDDAADLLDSRPALRSLKEAGKQQFTVRVNVRSGS